jgi:hypothetical protein
MEYLAFHPSLWLDSVLRLCFKKAEPKFSKVLQAAFNSFPDMSGEWLGELWGDALNLRGS